MTQPARRLALVLALALVGAGSAQAASYAEARVSVGNDPMPYNTYLAPLDYQASYSGALSVASVAGQTFTGLNYDGSTDTMTVSGSASAQVLGGDLKSKASYGLLGGITNAANAHYVQADFGIDPAGVPTTIGAWALAFSSQTLTVAGVAPVASIRLSLHLDGEISAAGAAQAAGQLFVAVRQGTAASPFAGGYQNVIYRTAVGAYDFNVQSLPVALVDGVGQVSLMLETNAFFGLDASWLQYVGRDASAGVDFFNTLGIAEVAGFAADGSAVQLTSVIDSAGNSYAVAAVVPEPAPLVLMLAGLAGLAVLTRRRTGKMPALH